MSPILTHASTLPCVAALQHGLLSRVAKFNSSAGRCYNASMNMSKDLQAIRKVCRMRFAQRKGSDSDERETLATCTACCGNGIFTLERTATSHRAVSCPFCDGFGANDSHMKHLYVLYCKTHKLPSTNGKAT